jgi:sporulation protein YhbH
MILRIERDHSRFRDIVKGRIRKEFRKYITKGEMIGRKGKNIISIPVPQIDIPHFRYGKNMGGVGHGAGEAGDASDGGQQGAGSGAGDQPGVHILEVEVTLEELAQILGEELELPRIQPKGTKHIVEKKDRYTGIRSTGPESLRHFKRTFRRSLRRQIASGTYDREKPVIIPTKEDRRYRSWKSKPAPRANAVVFYLMDVSGSMGDEQKEIVRITSFWIDTWLRYQYQDVAIRYVVHDAVAREVDRETFYHLRESGGTKISSAYSLLDKILKDEYDPEDWNIYAFHFSDGDNWGSGDTEICLKILDESIMPVSNLFAYGQVESPYGSGQFLKDVTSQFKDDETMVATNIPSKEKIYDAIKTFLGTGK